VCLGRGPNFPISSIVGDADAFGPLPYLETYGQLVKVDRGMSGTPTDQPASSHERSRCKDPEDDQLIQEELKSELPAHFSTP
jgi:hypothetical protein